MEDETARVRLELAAARRSLELSRRQKHGLERALANRIGSEHREIESLLAVTRGDPRELARMLISDRQNVKARFQEHRARLQTEMQLRARAELSLRDARATVSMQKNNLRQERERNKATSRRLRKANVDLEDSNVALANRVAQLEAEIVEAHASNLAHKAQRWEAAFVRNAHAEERQIERARRKAPDWAWQRAFDMRAHEYQSHSMPLLKSPIRVRGQVRRLKVKAGRRACDSEEGEEEEEEYEDDWDADEDDAKPMQKAAEHEKSRVAKAKAKAKRKRRREKRKLREHRTGYTIGTRSAGFEKRRAEKESYKALKAMSTVGLGQSYGMYGPPPRRFQRPSSLLRQVPQ